jgi:hypothetical protein
VVSQIVVVVGNVSRSAPFRPGKDEEAAKGGGVLAPVVHDVRHRGAVVAAGPYVVVSVQRATDSSFAIILTNL